MPATTHIRAFLLVFSGLCLVALIVVLADELGKAGWAKTVVDIGHSASRLFFGAIALSYISVEGGKVAMVLASWLKDSLNKRAEQRGVDRVLEAERRRKEGETLEQALARVEAEKAK